MEPQVSSIKRMNTLVLPSQFQILCPSQRSSSTTSPSQWKMKAWKLCGPRHCVCACSVVKFFVTPPGDPLSMGFSRPEYGSGYLFPSPEDLLNPGMEPVSPSSPALAGRFFLPLSHLVNSGTFSNFGLNNPL